MKLYFVRHGESVANILHEFSNSGLKHPLTEKGVEQAYVLAQSLSGLQVEQIYSSPVLRAVQTSQILAESLHTPVQITEKCRRVSVLSSKSWCTTAITRNATSSLSGMAGCTGQCYRPSSETSFMLLPANMDSLIPLMPWQKPGLTACIAAPGAE